MVELAEEREHELRTLRPDLVGNGSFASGTSGWGKYDPSGGTTTVTHRSSDGGQHSDLGYMRIRSATAAGGSVYTDVGTAPSIGDNFEATVYVRSPSGSSVPGTVRLWGLGVTNQSAATSFTADGPWKPVRVVLSPNVVGNSYFRIQVYLNTVNADLDVDSVGLRRVVLGAVESLTYDCNGSLLGRVTTNTPYSAWTSYMWDESHRLIGVVQAGQNPSRFVYDASGQRVLRVDPDVSKTVYLGSTELRWSPASPGSVKVARFYPGGTQRGFDGLLTNSVAGHQGSVMASVNASSGGGVWVAVHAVRCVACRWCGERQGVLG